ncbi:hypothetical protein HYPSUDRAFT_662455 [Hypholoma sublateritium FD-334 SS-4]|uniref:Uncharacterized protein n=1 Tax=Hypholoma sublateritium (strain FD-334 SS-4) TaxID=945553 RepID=A0A0D2P0R1_HYPSF|nr:hypothetical protein HYPSUDRAFT_662455 [Hypholoma sublateritium FD-334 SS-4]
MCGDAQCARLVPTRCSCPAWRICVVACCGCELEIHHTGAAMDTSAHGTGGRQGRAAYYARAAWVADIAGGSGHVRRLLSPLPIPSPRIRSAMYRL